LIRCIPRSNSKIKDVTERLGFTKMREELAAKYETGPLLKMTWRRI
jgi:hypothetical protein